MKTTTFFARNPVFRSTEFSAWRRSSLPKADNALLAYHVRAGHLVRIRRGLYATVPPGFSPETASVDPYLLASKLTEDALLAYHSALQLQGRAYALHQRVLFLTEHPIRPFEFRGMRFVAVSFPQALLAAGQEHFAVETHRHAGGVVRTTNLERTMVDVLARPDLGGGWEEVWRSLESVEFFDLDQVVDYTLMLDSATTVAKVGFFLDQHRRELFVTEEHLARLERHVPAQPRYMDRRARTPGKRSTRWNLIVPPAIQNRLWEESACIVGAEEEEDYETLARELDFTRALHGEEAREARRRRLLRAMENKEHVVALRLDQDVLDELKELAGDDYQPLINQALREWLDSRRE